VNTKLLIANCAFALLISSPVLLVVLSREFGRKYNDMQRLCGLFIPLAEAAFIGSKSGAGSHHLIPFLPISLYLAVSIITTTPPRGMNINIDIQEFSVLLLISLFLLTSMVI
jgi:hypothetical protein